MSGAQMVVVQPGDPEPEQPRLMLHRKLAQVMYEAERIPKHGKAPDVMGGFAFVQVGDAADYIRKALAEKVISMVPSTVEVVGETEHPTSKGGTMTTLELRVTWTLTDGETGETAQIQSFGAGADTGDKYSGKAMTNAMKYALLAGFLLSTGDDPELSDTSDRTRTRPTGNGPVVPARKPSHEATADGGLIGTAQVGEAPADFQLREEPEGWALSFKLMDGRKGFRVVARDDLALRLAEIRDAVLGQRVTCWGRMGTASMVKGSTTINYNVLELDRIETPDLPNASSPSTEGAADEPAAPDDTADGTAEATVEAGESPGSPVLCGSSSPYGDGLACTLLSEHKGPHKNLEAAFPTTWTD